MATAPDTIRETLRQEVLSMVGGGMNDVEIDGDSLNNAINLAFRRYRQRSSNAVEEAYTFLTLIPDVNEYILPSETIEVRDVFRRRMGTGGIGDGSAGGIQFDPFDIAFTNLYLLQASSMGGLLTFNLYNQYLNTASVMFGGKYNFTWNAVSKKLQLVRDPRDQEEVLLWVYKYRPEDYILDDPYSYMWIFEASVAYAKMMIGEAREMFGSLAGPNGGVQLNGSAMKAEAQATLKDLDDQIAKFVDGGTPLGFLKG